jgi:hypothetical protein
MLWWLLAGLVIGFVLGRVLLGRKQFALGQASAYASVEASLVASLAATQQTAQAVNVSIGSPSNGDSVQHPIERYEHQLIHRLSGDQWPSAAEDDPGAIQHLRGAEGPRFDAHEYVQHLVHRGERNGQSSGSLPRQLLGPVVPGDIARRNLAELHGSLDELLNDYSSSDDDDHSADNHHAAADDLASTDDDHGSAVNDDNDSLPPNLRAAVERARKRHSRSLLTHDDVPHDGGDLLPDRDAHKEGGQ